jgi:hypothetical protein
MKLDLLMPMVSIILYIFYMIHLYLIIKGLGQASRKWSLGRQCQKPAKEGQEGETEGRNVIFHIVIN